MRATLNDWKNGWFGVSLGIAPEEIDRLVESLRRLKSDPTQHFHISSDYKEACGLGDVEVYIKERHEEDNVFLSGLALAPGAEVDTEV